MKDPQLFQVGPGNDRYILGRTEARLPHGLYTQRELAAWLEFQFVLADQVNRAPMRLQILSPDQLGAIAESLR